MRLVWPVRVGMPAEMGLVSPRTEQPTFSSQRGAKGVYLLAVDLHLRLLDIGLRLTAPIFPL